MVTTISTKGQVTIPKSVRDELGLHTGAKVSFVVVGNKAEITPLTTPVTALKNMLPKNKKKLSLAQIEAGIAKGAANEGS